MGVYMRITQFYSKIDPRKLHKKAMHSTSTLWQYGKAVGHLPREITTTCWYFLEVYLQKKQPDSVQDNRPLLLFRDPYGKGLIVPCRCKLPQTGLIPIATPLQPAMYFTEYNH